MNPGRVRNPDADLDHVALMRELKAAANLTDPATAALDGLFGPGVVPVTHRTMPPSPLLDALLEEIDPPALTDIAPVEVYQSQESNFSSPSRARGEGCARPAT